MSAPSKPSAISASALARHGVPVVANRGGVVPPTFERGSIVEQGNHADLLAADGAYARLYNAQF